MPGLRRFGNLFCLGCNNRDSRLEDSCPVPPIGTPTYELYVKHGVGPITYNEVWIKYTRKDGVLKWPQYGSFDTEILDNLEVKLFKKKARPAMFDSFRLWRKEAKQKEIKLAKKNKRERGISIMQAAMQFKDNEEEQMSEQLHRQRKMVIDKCYPVLPPLQQDAAKELEKDPLMAHLLSSPPPYEQNATAPPQPLAAQPVVALPPAPPQHPPATLQLAPAPPVQPTQGPPALTSALPLPATTLTTISTTTPSTSPDTASTSASSNSAFPLVFSSTSPSVRQRVASTVTSILYPFFGAASPAPVSEHKQLRSKQPDSREKETLNHLAYRWVTDPTIYDLNSVIDVFHQWEASKQRYVFEKMCTFLCEDLEENDLDSNPPELSPVRFEFSKGAIVGSDVRKAVATLLSLRTEGVSKSLFEYDSSAKKKARQYPMREVPPQWREGDLQANPPIQPHFQRVWVHVPWKRAEVLALKQTLPDPRKNPAGYYKELSQTAGSCIMNLADIDMLFGNVVPQPLWGKICHTDHDQELGDSWANIAAADALQIGGSKPEPLVAELPGKIIDYMKTIMPAMRVNWDKLSACKQKKEETVSDFFTRFEETFVDHSGQDMSTEGGQRLFVDKFVHNLLPELCEKLKDSESSWAVSSSAQILATAQYYENRDKDEKDRAEKKTKELKTKVLLQQAYPPRGGGGQNNGGQNNYQSNYQQPQQYQRISQRVEYTQPRVPVGPNQCSYCKEEGHFKNSCPILLQRANGVSNTRGRGVQQAPRGRGRGNIPQNARHLPPQNSMNRFDQQNNASGRTAQYYADDYYTEDEQWEGNDC
ncbi:uncharacterized protein LOC144797594 [Lissotriton helveticus]